MERESRKEQGRLLGPLGSRSVAAMRTRSTEVHALQSAQPRFLVLKESVTCQVPALRGQTDLSLRPTNNNDGTVTLDSPKVQEVRS